MLRGNLHDQSKFEDVEFLPYSEVIDEFAKYPYGSPERDKLYASIKPASEHHFKNNRHHPEYFSNGIEGMNLVDLIEMLVDWKSATQNHPAIPGDLKKSIEIASKKYNISPQLTRVLYNTAIDFEML